VPTTVAFSACPPAALAVMSAKESPVVCNSRVKNERCRQNFNVKDMANPRCVSTHRERIFLALALVIIKSMGKAAVKKSRVKDGRSSLDAPQKDIAPPMLS
jgi:hypothetical protein